MNTLDELKTAYAKMAAMTKPLCGGPTCAPYKPGRCCERFHCEITRVYALEVYGKELPFVDPDADAPYIRDNVCTVEPYLRPACSLHSCKIAALGFIPNDLEWTERYFELREEIGELEGKYMGERTPLTNERVEPL